MTVQEFVGNLLAPARPIGPAVLGVGFALWLWGIVVMIRGQNESPAES